MKIKKIIFISGLWFLLCTIAISNTFLKTKTHVKINTPILQSAATDAGFKDSNLYSCILNANGKEAGYVFSNEELAAITSVDCEDKGITDTTGIEKMTNLEKLYLHNNLISSINLSNNLKLNDVILSNNKLSNLDVSKNTALEHLYASGNTLTNINLTNNTNLIDINLSFNNLTSISLPNSEKLQQLELYSNSLKEINLTNNTGLQKLLLSCNQLTSIDLTKNTNLLALYISSNNLNSINLKSNTQLTQLNISYNQFDSIDLSNQKAVLKLLAIDDNIATKLDYSEFTNLTKVGTGYYYIIPVYGNSYQVKNLFDYVPSNIKYDSYKIYDTSIYDNYAYPIASGTYNEKNDLISSQIIYNNNRNSINIRLDTENPQNSALTNYSGEIDFTNYYTLLFTTITSDKYTIDETNSIINVGSDTNNDILSHITSSNSSISSAISGNELQLSYNGQTFKTFTLTRTNTTTNTISENPKTGDILIQIIALLLIICVSISILMYQKKIVIKR